MHLEQLTERREIQPKPLPYSLDALEPVMGKETINLHYNIMTKGYFKKYNATGDETKYAGAFLHTLWWDNLRPVKNGNEPTTNSALIHIEKHFKTYDRFKKKFTDEALAIKGSGWCAALADGRIIQIPFHKIVKDIVLILDRWEHSYIFDYGDDKEKYIDNFWKIVNWDTVDKRLLARYAF